MYMLPLLKNCLIPHQQGELCSRYRLHPGLDNEKNPPYALLRFPACPPKLQQIGAAKYSGSLGVCSLLSAYQEPVTTAVDVMVRHLVDCPGLLVGHLLTGLSGVSQFYLKLCSLPENTADHCQ